MKNNNKVIITYGTFDMFHIGHLRLLKRLKKKGNYLIVGVSTDKFNKKRGKNLSYLINKEPKWLKASSMLTK